ncbi:MAG: LamG-like jellyroll fold domain-containing protein [Planctomycetota bacterium]
MTRPDHEINAYLEGTLTTEQAVALEAWINASPDHAAAFLHMVRTHQVLETIGDEARLNRQAEQFNPVAMASLAKMEAETTADNGDLLTDLQEAESQGKALDAIALASARFPEQTEAATHGINWLAAGSYLLQHTFTPRRITALATAAAVLLGVVITVVLLSGPGEVEPVAVRPGFAPATPTADPYRVVATVTDQVNAQWVTANGRGALPDRMLLAINQRLTLVQGFAEITTKRGAAVLLQAPATIETTDSDNAIRLHRGRLVGRCDTPSSKGFTVHAPGMDVVDLGTEFGVAAEESKGSIVFVMSGAVRAEPASTSPLAFEPVVVQQGDALRVVPETGQLQTLSVADAMLFHRGSNHPYVEAVLSAEPIAFWRFEEAAREQDGQPYFTVRNERDHETYSLNSAGSAVLDAQGLLGSAGRLNNKETPRGYFALDGLMDGLADTESLTIQLWFRADDHHIGTLIDYYDDSDDQADPKHIAVVELQSSADLTNADQLDSWKRNSARMFYNSPPQSYGLTRFSHNLFSSQTYRAEQWHQLVLIKNPNGIQLYIDGRLSSSHNTALARSPIGQLMIGVSSKVLVRSLDGDEDIRPFSGLIDEIAVYDRALSSEEITNHWALAKDLFAITNN